MTLIPAGVVVPDTEPGGRIFQTCENILVTLRELFRASGVQLPDLQFVSNGAVAYDTDLLAVEVLRLRPGKPGIPTIAAVDAGTSYSLETLIHLIRGVPVLNDAGEPPTADETEASARQLQLDWWVVFQGILLGRRAASMGDPGALQGAPYRDIMIQEVVPYGPTGAVGGLVATLVVEMV